MLHPQYLREGSQVEIPELSGHIAKGSAIFNVIGVHAGGMGICLHLRHTETGVQYALKGIRPDHIGDQASLDRFLDELQVWLSASMCSLVAEAIAVVRINETPCVLGAWMQKGDLAHALPNLSHRQKLETLIRMVRGLSWVSNNLGIIHRDLKPANVLLDQDNLAFVADWGLARPVGHAMASVRASLNEKVVDRPDRTQAGSFLGTVTYAAPEQILGAADIDHRADIYALGCMMFEFETGAPPFTGQTVADIARQHIQTQPPKLGGWFKRTELGLEKVIAKCLEKKPEFRYSTYEELDDILAGLARRQGITLDRCAVTTRYERAPIGKGHLKQDVVLDQAPAKGKDGYAVVEFDDVLSFLEEATNLMALGRYAEAEKLLRPHFLPEMMFEHLDCWSYPHSIALNYSQCLLHIGRLEDAYQILHRLDTRKDKPAELYVNYSQILLAMGKWTVAAEVGREGLRYFPNDPDILGNLTVALENLGDLDGAEDTAVRRLKLRRDVHSIEEAVSVLQRQAKANRNIDLPNAVSKTKIAGDLVKEGLALNPRVYSLRLKEIQLRRFAHDEKLVLDLYQTMIESNDCPLTYRQLAFAEMVETLAEGKSFKFALDMIQRSGDRLTERLLALKMHILARHFMLEKNNSSGQRIVIPEVRNYFLGENSDRSIRNPVVAAEILEWMNESEKAVEMLERYLSAVPTDWEGIRTMSLLHLKMGKPNEALQVAKLLSTTAPWRAESYDCLCYVAQQSDRPEIAQLAKLQGDEIFSKESALFDDLRAYLDA